MVFVLNLFEDVLLNLTPRDSRVPPPRWYVAYYRNGRDTFIYAARYLVNEIGTIPEGNLKKKNEKGVLIKDEDITQAKMLEHLPCPADNMFETIKVHHTFNKRAT